MSERALSRSAVARRFPAHGWLGLALVGMFWPLNWLLDGLRTHWGFFPLWLGFCLTIDGLNVFRRGTSLLYRDWKKYLALYAISVPIWWLFEVVNWRAQNWRYLGREFFSDVEYALLASLSFSTVVPAVLGSAELVAGFDFIQRFRRGPVASAGRRMPALLLASGIVMLLSLLTWPQLFFPFVWIFVYLLLAPINIWLGNRTLFEWTSRGDWRPVVALCMGVWVCAFFWEMWNYFSFPKWIYSVPYLGFWKIFEMPFFGYFGYWPFALELFALVHLIFGMFGERKTEYVTSGLVID